MRYLIFILTSLLMWTSLVFKQEHIWTIGLFMLLVLLFQVKNRENISYKFLSFLLLGEISAYLILTLLTFPSLLSDTGLIFLTILILVGGLMINTGYLIWKSMFIGKSIGVMNEKKE